MASPNYSEIATTTLVNRSGDIADNVLKNNATLARLKQKGRVKTFDGGEYIVQELSYQENGNAQWYSGYDTIGVSAVDLLTSAQYPIKQLAVTIPISGLEELQNSGKERALNLLESKIEVSESTLANKIAEGVYSDGTGSGGKELGGLDLLVPVDPTTGTAGGINRATWSFWRSKIYDSGALSVSTIQAAMNYLWARLVRGSDHPDLIVFDNILWGYFEASMQQLQRFASADKAGLGFPSLDYKGAEVVFDGGVGGFAGDYQGYFLNTKYLFFRPHKDRNMVPIGGDRSSTNQDARVKMLGFAGNMASSNLSLQGRLDATP